jgi:hypothetical protein
MQDRGEVGGTILQLPVCSPGKTFMVSVSGYGDQPVKTDGFFREGLKKIAGGLFSLEEPPQPPPKKIDFTPSVGDGLMPAAPARQAPDTAVHFSSSDIDVDCGSFRSP